MKNKLICLISNLRHFIVLIASSRNHELYMDWVRLVESKIRHLVQSLERNPHISLAHVNPQGFHKEKEMYESYFSFKV